MVGVHPDNLKRGADKLMPQRLDGLRDLALRAETVAIYAGLDFGRDIGTRCVRRHKSVPFTPWFAMHFECPFAMCRLS